MTVKSFVVEVFVQHANLQLATDLWSKSETKENVFRTFLRTRSWCHDIAPIGKESY
jgi:hypothetical protein